MVKNKYTEILSQTTYNNIKQLLTENKINDSALPDEIINDKDNFTLQLESSLYKEERTTNKFTCNECGVVVYNTIYEHEHGKCPHCGKLMGPLFEDIDINEKRFVCPKCHTSYKYHKINENECSICHSEMTIYEKPKVIKQNKSLPTT